MYESLGDSEQLTGLSLISLYIFATTGVYWTETLTWQAPREGIPSVPRDAGAHPGVPLGRTRGESTTTRQQASVDARSGVALLSVAAVRVHGALGLGRH